MSLDHQRQPPWILKGPRGSGSARLRRVLPTQAVAARQRRIRRTDADRATLHPNAFVGIGTDGTVYVWRIVRRWVR